MLKSLDEDEDDGNHSHDGGGVYSLQHNSNYCTTSISPDAVDLPPGVQYSICVINEYSLQ